MTENEFMREMIKAAGGDPDKLPDRLKSTYYQCLINCMKSGGGSGGGSAGSNVEVLNVYTEDLVNFTLDKTFEELANFIAEGKIVVASLVGGMMVLPCSMFMGDEIQFSGIFDENARSFMKLRVLASGGALMEMIALPNLLKYTATSGMVSGKACLTCDYNEMIEAAENGLTVQLEYFGNHFDLIDYNVNEALFRRSYQSQSGEITHLYLVVNSSKNITGYTATETIVKFE